MSGHVMLHVIAISTDMLDLERGVRASRTRSLIPETCWTSNYGGIVQGLPARIIVLLELAATGAVIASCLVWAFQSGLRRFWLVGCGGRLLGRPSFLRLSFTPIVADRSVVMAGN